jgi:hypothetical protein
VDAGTRTGARILRVVVVTTVAVVGGAILLAYALFNYAGAVLGWLWTSTTFAAWGAVAALLAVPAAWPRARRRAVITTAAVLAVAGIVLAHVAPPTPSRLRQVIGQLDLPEGWEVVSDHAGGNGLCLDYCFDVTRTYEARGDTGDLVERTRRRLAERGLGADGDTYSGHRGDVYLTVTIRRDGTLEVVAEDR